MLADWDDADGAADGLIWDPGVVKYSQAGLDTLLRGLTDAQRTTIDLILEGYDIGGDLSQPAFPLSSIEHAASWMGPFVASVSDTWFRAAFGPTFDYVDAYDFGSIEQERAFQAAWDDLGYLDARQGTDMSDFGDRGGKLLMWYGVDDPFVSYAEGLQIFGDVVAASGDVTLAKQWSRLFLVPGIGHCGGGTGPQDVPTQALGALVRWVEEGDAPDGIVASNPDGRTFLLCSYPDRAVFKGRVHNQQGLDLSDAANWRCRPSWRHR